MPTLKRLREEAMLTQEELAHACGVSRQAVVKWEHGQSRPSIPIQRKLVEVLGKTPREVLEAIDATAEQAKKRAAA
jgi:DNA-binding XRE family transcriptional regulator